MGLDMYLNAKRFLWGQGEDVQIAKAITELLPELSKLKRGASFREDPVREICIEAMYWRKANAIHAWFVRNVQGGQDDCGNYRVDRTQLQELASLIDQVLAQKDKAGALLPPQSGFFFGSAEVDEYYYSDLQRTKDGIANVLELPDCWDFEYHSSW